VFTVKLSFFLHLKVLYVTFLLKWILFFIGCVWRGCNHTLQWSTCRVLLLPLKTSIPISMWSLRVGFPAKSKNHIDRFFFFFKRRMKNSGYKNTRVRVDKAYVRLCFEGSLSWVFVIIHHVFVCQVQNEIRSRWLRYQEGSYVVVPVGVKGCQMDTPF